MKKGSPTKPTNRLPTTEEDSDELVKVHMYNQSQATRHEGSRGVLRIKERLPEKWQTAQQENQLGVLESNHGCSDTCQDSGSAGCGGRDNSDHGNQTVISAETTKVGCSECGCVGVHAVPSTSGDNLNGLSAHKLATRVLPSPKTLPSSPPFDMDSISEIMSENRLDSQSEKKLESRSDNRPENSSENRPDSRTEARLLRDDIQIPVVSSSTVSPGPDDRWRKHRICGRLKGATGTVSTEKSDTRRRTRSNIHVTPGMEIENKEQNPVAANNNNEWKEEQHKEGKAGTSTKGRQAIGNSALDSSYRVLKSVNRGTAETLSQSSSKAVTSKRKRTSDLEGESSSEPVPKSARIHTRSHTWSYKSMVTRSQEKTHKTPAKPPANPKK